MLRWNDLKPRPLNLAIAVLIAIFVGLASAVGLFTAIEDRATEWRSKILPREPTGETVIVEIDARSLSELESWPWPRHHHAELVRQLDKADARSILFDVDFSARSAGGDADLGRAIGEAGNVILPIFQQPSSALSGGRDMTVNRPSETFDAAWVGGVNIFPDADGLVRDYPAATIIDREVRPSLATLAAENDDLGVQSFRPDWSIEADQIPRYSFVDVMRGRIPAAHLKGKRVLVGATAIELGDRYAVPRYGVVPGVLIQALAVESLLQGRAIRATGLLATIVGSLLIALLFMSRAVERPVRLGVLYLSTAAGLLALPLVVQWWYPIAIDTVAWLTVLTLSAAVQIVMELRRRLRTRARIDLETDLPNRAMLEHTLRLRSDQSTLIVAGIERFESIRDGIGIAATNELIGNSALRVEQQVDCQVFRIAPDVLAWLVATSGERPLREHCTRIEEGFRTPVTTSAGPIDVNLTFGLEQGGGSAHPVLLIEHALTALTQARSAGKPFQRYRRSDPNARRQLSMMGELRSAMERGQLRLAYQPKLSLPAGRIGGAEALIRWSDDQGNSIPPDMFIPLAEATGVVREVTKFALAGVLKDQRRWAESGVRLPVAVNVSAIDLSADGFVEDVLKIVEQGGGEPALLTFEITETALIRSPATAIAALGTLREMGIRLSIDDYGTGQSTLSYLKHLPVQELKIDRSFVTGLTASEPDAIMVRSTVDLAHQLGLKVVAEGVEDQPTLDLLREIGCDYAQGYLISRPVDPDSLLALVADPLTTRRVA